MPSATTYAVNAATTPAYAYSALSLEYVVKNVNAASRISRAAPAPEAKSPRISVTSANENMAPSTVPCIRSSAALNDPPTAPPSRVPTIATVSAAHEPLPLTAKPTPPATAHAHESLSAYASWSRSAWNVHRSTAAIESPDEASPEEEEEGPRLRGAVSDASPRRRAAVASSPGSSHASQRAASPSAGFPAAAASGVLALSWYPARASHAAWKLNTHRWFACSARRATVSAAAARAARGR